MYTLVMAHPVPPTSTHQRSRRSVHDLKNIPRSAALSYLYGRVGANGFGVNGHVNLVFSGPTLTTTYVDLNGNLLLEEEWSVAQDGSVQLMSKKKKNSDPNFHA